jgi:hypothetical protein
MKQGKEFDNILDDCLERILLKGETLEHCLRRYPQQAAELGPLLETVLAVKKASSVEPRPEFKARARYQFRSALGEKAAPKSRPFFGWLPRWATVLAIVLVLLVAGSGTVAAAGGSMPDGILYPVKLATENVQMAFTVSPLDKAQLCAELADERVAEIIYMAEKGDAQSVEEVTGYLDDRLETLAELASGLEGDDAEAMLSVTSGGEEAAAPPPETTQPTEPTEPMEPVEPVPPVTILVEEGGWGGNRAQDQAGFKATVADAATNNQAVLEAMLDSVPASVRSALEEAIEVSENGYAQVLAALE